MTYTHHLKSAATAGILLAPALLLTGCSKNSVSSSGGVSLAAGLIVPDESNRLLANTEDSLVGNCMRRSGFKYTYSPIGVGEKLSDPLERDLYRDNVEKARREGYGISAPQSDKKPEDQSDKQMRKYIKSLTKQQKEEYENTLYGHRDAQRIKTEVKGLGTASDPTEGCLVEARKKLYGDYNRWVGASTLVRTRFKSIGDSTKADPKYIDVTRAWRSCMAKKGYAYKDPYEAESKFLDKFSGQADKRPEEIKLAVDDAECDRQVGRSKVNRELFDKYTQVWAEQNEAHVTAYRELVTQAVQRAKSLL